MASNLNENQKRIRKRIIVNNQTSQSSFVPIITSKNNNDFYKGKSFIKNSYNKKDFFKSSPQNSHTFFKKYENKSENSDIESGVKPKPKELSIRINKYISNAGICSRREADNLILRGEISVNGKIVKEVGTKININDVVEHKGKKIFEAQHVYILLNKPKDTITTTKDPENRVTVMDIVEKATNQRIFPVGRLDRNTTGVILLTNDGDFAQKLSHPASNVKKIYYVELSKPLENNDFETIKNGVNLSDGFIKADDIAYVDNENKSNIGIEIHSGRNRIVRRMFEHLGYKVKKLDRVVYAGLDKGGLKKGKWRFLRYNEVQSVLNSI
ncbi:MAG: rRNA pseudouridine synthase [Bacteroidia bacterium]|nr:rRNA pseudouridine synthase [Bacteroidia bacterium]